MYISDYAIIYIHISKNKKNYDEIKRIKTIINLKEGNNFVAKMCIVRFKVELVKKIFKQLFRC